MVDPCVSVPGHYLASNSQAIGSVEIVEQDTRKSRIDFQKSCTNGCNDPVRIWRAARDIEDEFAHRVHRIDPLICSHSACYALLGSRDASIGSTCPKGNNGNCIFCKPECCTCHGDICAGTKVRIIIMQHIIVPGFSGFGNRPWHIHDAAELAVCICL